MLALTQEKNEEETDGAMKHRARRGTGHEGARKLVLLIVSTILNYLYTCRLFATNHGTTPEGQNPRYRCIDRLQRLRADVHENSAS